MNIAMMEIENNEMTTVDDANLYNFYKENEENFLLPYPNYENQVVWEDFDDVKTMLRNRSDLHVMTIVTCEDDEAYIIGGWHFVNRIGYILLTEEPKSKEDVRWW